MNLGCFVRGGLRFGCRARQAGPSTGGIALQEGATRRRHAARGLRVVQNPRHHRCGGCWRDRGPGCGAHEWRQGLAGFRDATTRPRPDKFRMQFPHGTIQHKPKNRRISTIRFQNLKYFQGNCMRNYRDAVRTQHHTATRPRSLGSSGGSEGLAAVPVGGGGAWPGFEAPRRAKLAARTTRGRAAAHGRTKQPGPTAGPSGARNTRGAPSSPARQRIQKRPPGTGWAHLSRLWESNPRPIHYE